VNTGNAERAEISYDLVMEEDMAFVEGTYRLPGARLHATPLTMTAERVVETDRGRHNGSPE
jgi:hypothetical protein